MVSSTGGTGGLSQVEQFEYDELPIVYRKPRSRLSRAIGLAFFLMVLAGIAFGATYLYSEPDAADAARHQAADRFAAVEA